MNISNNKYGTHLSFEFELIERIQHINCFISMYSAIVCTEYVDVKLMCVCVCVRVRACMCLRCVPVCLCAWEIRCNKIVSGIYYPAGRKNNVPDIVRCTVWVCVAKRIFEAKLKREFEI